MSFLKPLNTVYVLVYNLYDRWMAARRKRRSLEHLSRLDDHLLDDIGLIREEGEIVPNNQLRKTETIVAGSGVIAGQKNSRLYRLRLLRLVRRRQE